MATDMGLGITAPDSTDRVSSTGVAEMRRLATTVVAAIALVDEKLGPRGDVQRRMDALEAEFERLGEDAIRELITQIGLDPLVAELIPPGSQTHEALREWIGAGGSGSAVNAKDHGATGDGVTDDSQALADALAAAAGEALFIPAGRYRVTADNLHVRAGTTVYGEPGTVIVGDGGTGQNVFWARGSYSGHTTVEIAQPAGLGDRTLTTKTPHQYQPGDVLRLVSQRVATSTDAGEWMLGWPAGGAPRFSECVTVESAPNNRTIELSSGLIFPGYRPDNSQETDPGAESSSLLMQTNGAGDDITIRDLRIECGDSSRAIRITRSRGARVERVHITLDTPGRGVQLEDCYQVHVIDTHIEVGAHMGGTGGHATRNVFHVAGCHSSGFTRCSATRGTQAYDFTYSNAVPYTSVYCWVTDSASYSTQNNPVTIHPGTYGIRVTGNDFTECRGSGIGVRGHGSVITDNTLQGSLRIADNGTHASGIYIYEGGGVETLVAGNTVRGFHTGIRINDGGGKPFGDWIGVTIQGNQFRDFSTGYFRLRGWGEPQPTEPQGVGLQGNQFISDRDAAVGVMTCENGRGANGLVVQGNSFRLTAADSTGVLVTANSVDTVVRGNTFHRVGRPARWDGAQHGSDSPTSVLHWAGNQVLQATNPGLPSNATGFELRVPEAGSGGGDYDDRALWDALTSKAEDVRVDTIASDLAELVQVDTTTAGTKVTVGGQVVHYDSGRRDIRGTSLIAEGITIGRHAWLQRVGDVVTLALYDAAFSASGTVRITGDLPLGFRPVDREGLTASISSSQQVEAIVFATGLYVYGAPSSGGRLRAVFRWSTADPIPTTRPGTPA